MSYKLANGVTYPSLPQFPFSSNSLLSVINGELSIPLENFYPEAIAAGLIIRWASHWLSAGYNRRFPIRPPIEP